MLSLYHPEEKFREQEQENYGEVKDAALNEVNEEGQEVKERPEVQERTQDDEENEDNDLLNATDNKREDGE